MNLIQYETLTTFTNKVLTAAGLDAYSCEAVTTGLCETSLRGVDTHGIRLLPHYAQSALSGRKNPRPQFAFTQTFPALGCLEADNAFGHAAGMKAVEHCIAMADTCGIGAVGVRNSSHPGAMASFALKAARQGYIAFALTHADALLLSYGGTRAFFGTNPICMAAPREEQEPYCLDMATSIIPWNKVRLHKDQGERLPEQVAADSSGRDTVDPGSAACLLPTGTYKGYGLASMVEVMCSIFTGMAFGLAIPAMFKEPMDKPRRLGQFYMVLRCDGCVSAEEFMHSLQEMSDAVRREPSRPGETVMLPGDKEIREAEKRRREGIPLDQLIYTELKALSKQFNVGIELL